MDYVEQYKAYSDDKLIKIVQSRDDYHELAWEAAAHELSNRGYNIEEVEELNEEMDNVKLGIAGQLEHVANDIYQTTLNFFSWRHRAGEEELVTRLSILMAIYSLIVCYNTYSDLRYYGFSLERYSEIESWLIAAFLPSVATVLLWKGKAIGWSICVFVCMFYVLTQLVVFISYFIRFDSYMLFENYSMDIANFVLTFIVLFCCYTRKIINYLKVDQMQFWVTTLSTLLYSLYVSMGLIKYYSTL